MDTIDALVEDLRGKEIAVSAEGDHLLLDGPVGEFMPAMKALLRRHKADLLTYLNTASANSVLQQEIRQATYWGSLSEIMDRTQIAYEDGKVMQQEAEELVRLAWTQSQSITGVT